MPSTRFYFANESAKPIKICIEPEAAVYELVPNDRLEVRLFGEDKPVLMAQSLDSHGNICVSFWPENGSFELYRDGVNLWDLM